MAETVILDMTQVQDAGFQDVNPVESTTNDIEP